MLDRRQELALLPLEDDEAARLLAVVPEDDRGKCWWLVLPDGTAVPGDDGGGVAVFLHMRPTRPLGRALTLFRASPLLDALDKLVARYRGRLGRIVPDGVAPTRYP